MKSEQKLSKKMFIHCKEAAFLSTISETGELTFYQKIQLGIHNLLCKVCKTWAKQSTELTTVIKKAFNCETHKMCEKKKAELEKDLEKLSA